MGLLSIFGSVKAVNTVADTVKAGVTMFDEAFYTNQEKAANAGKMVDAWLETQKITAQENSIRSITRRILAWSVMGLFLFLVLFACVIWKFDPAWALYIKHTIVETQLMYLAMIVGFFYFGYYGVTSIMKKRKGD